ncbi:MAG TPA: PQQ-binding-like beta-propeller repeat protein [Gemmataceae bacterium]|nr:PQQ-binding-like beta-propeller repeat protein [Gemmataceae bacterium]
MPRPAAFGLLLLAIPAAVAAPQKEDLPAGAVGRLGAPVPVTKGEPRPGEVNALAFLDENSLFVGTDAGWRVWDVAKRQPRQEKPAGGPAFAAFRQADRLFIGSSRKLHSLEPAQSATAEPARSWDSTAVAVGVLAGSPDGGRVVFSDGEQKLTILDVKTGKVTGTAEFASRPVAATLTANGRVLAVVTRDGAARVYHLSPDGSLEPQWSKRVARSDRAAAQFSPDGRLLAVSTAGRVMILDAVTGRPMQSVERRFGEGDVRCLVFSPDGKQVAIGTNGPDAIVRVADVVTAHEQATFVGHAGDVNAVAFAPGGRTLASGGTDQAVILWKVPVPPPGPALLTTGEAWETLDSLDADVAYRSTGTLLAHPGRAVTVIRDGYRGTADEQVKIRRWIAELDHDEFRVREAARRSLLKAGLRSAAALNDTGRKKMGVEGETRVRLILEALESQGVRIPESGLFGEPLRGVRGVRVLESIGGNEARSVLEEVAKGTPEARLTREAKAALATLPADPR